MLLVLYDSLRCSVAVARILPASGAALSRFSGPRLLLGRIALLRRCGLLLQTE